MGDRGGDQGSAGLRWWSGVGDGGEEVGEVGVEAHLVIVVEPHHQHVTLGHKKDVSRVAGIEPVVLLGRKSSRPGSVSLLDKVPK